MNGIDSPHANRGDGLTGSLDLPRDGRAGDAYALLARLTRLAIIGEYDARQRLPQLLGDSLRMVGTDRAIVWRMTNGGEQLVVEALASHVPGAERVVMPLDAHTNPHYFRAVHSGEVIVASLDQIDPPLSELWTDYAPAHGIGAKLDIPLIAIGRTVGLVSFERTNAQPTWSTDDVTLALSIANLVQLGNWEERGGIARIGPPGEYVEHSLPAPRSFRPF